ncbi:MAG: IS200/IS605 family transposase [Thermodesulfobacteriota bacterium]
MSGKYWTGAHTRHRLKYHLVWIPKYRRRVLRGKIAGRIGVLFYQCAEVNGWYIEEMNINKDHIHMLVQVTPDVSVSKVVQYFKGGSSRVIRQEYPELEEFLWGDSLWADGYFAETVGIVQEEMVKRYIREQTSSMPEG